MKRFFGCPLLLLCAFVLAAPTSTTVQNLIAQREDLHRKEVTVKGKVKDFVTKVSRTGNPYFGFKLVDGPYVVPVYGMGKLKKEPKSGDSVTVTGKFQKEKKLFDKLIENEIDVTPKTKELEPGVVLD